MQVLVGEEVETRCRDMPRYKGNVEYIQQVLNRVGDKFKEGTSTLEFEYSYILHHTMLFIIVVTE